MFRRSANVNQNGNGILVFPISKKEDKSKYKPARMIAARGAFQRHLNSLERGISL